jgi:hypothetical protein
VVPLAQLSRRHRPRALHQSQALPSPSAGSGAPIGDAGRSLLDAVQQAVAQRGDVGLFHQLGAFALAHVQVGGAQGVVGQQCGVEGQLHVFGRVLHAAGGCG